MKAIVMVGLPASGKSTFVKENLYDQYVRINLDMLKNRHRENALLQACILTQTPFVIDNTNLKKSERLKYISLAKLHRFPIYAYVFDTDYRICVERNQSRERVVPEKAMKNMLRYHQPVEAEEGFDQIMQVSLEPSGYKLLKTIKYEYET